MHQQQDTETRCRRTARARTAVTACWLPVCRHAREICPLLRSKNLRTTSHQSTPSRTGEHRLEPERGERCADDESLPRGDVLETQRCPADKIRAMSQTAKLTPRHTRRNKRAARHATTSRHSLWHCLDRWLRRLGARACADAQREGGGGFGLELLQVAHGLAGLHVPHVDAVVARRHRQWQVAAAAGLHGRKGKTLTMSNEPGTCGRALSVAPLPRPAGERRQRAACDPCTSSGCAARWIPGQSTTPTIESR